MQEKNKIKLFCVASCASSVKQNWYLVIQVFKSRSLLYHVLLNINKRHTQSCTCHRQYITVFTPISNYIETDETSMIIVLALRPEVLLFCWSV